MTTASARGPLRANRTEIRRALALLCEQGQVYELRALPSKGGTLRGYFDNLDRLADSAARSCDELKPGGVYLTLNPVKRDLLARSSNKAEKYAKHATADVDVLRRRWLPLDFDPVRPSGISSTDPEHEAALARARDVREFLRAYGFPDPSFSDSGNGGHLVYRIDLPNDDDSRELLKHVVEALDALFSDEAVAVDKSTFNAARIWKLYGSIARKGDSTPERPHRLARIIEAPERLQVVSLDGLQQVAALLPEPERPKAGAGPAGRFDLRTFINANGIAVKRETSWNGGRRWVLEHCVFDPAHTGSSAAIVQLSNGAIAYCCQHNSCRDRKWADVRELFEPNYRRHDTALTTKDASALTEQSRGRRPAGLRTVADYMNDLKALESRKALISGLAFEGETVLMVGRAMSGKSTTACALARCFARGASFLGRAVTRARVGYLALERNGQTVARLFDRWGLNEILFTDEVPGMQPGALAQFLEQQIIEHRLEVLFVDHLQNLVRVADANDYATVSNALEPFAAVARRTGCVLVLLHHLPKTRREDGEIDALGSEAYRGAADCFVELTRSGGRYFLRAEARGEGFLPRTIVTIDLDTGEARGIDVGQAEARDAETAIRNFLATQTDPVDAKTIRNGTKLKTRIVGAILKARAEAGTFLRTGTGKPRDRYLYQVPPTPPDQPATTPPAPSTGKRGNESENRRGTRQQEQRPDSFPFVSQASLGKTGNESVNAQFAALPQGLNRFPAAGKRIAPEPLSGNESARLDEYQTGQEATVAENAGNAGNESETREAETDDESSRWEDLE